MREVIFVVDAVLWDMDGTLVDSTAGVVGAWETFKETYLGLDIHEILSSSHGVRTVDNLRTHCGITDVDELQREAERFEKAILDSSTKNGRKGIVMLPGVARIMKDLEPAFESGRNLWAICTSATRVYASAAIQVAGISKPNAFVCAEDVSQGKPFPDPYLRGALLCEARPDRCLVVEDAPAGILSGKAAGCKVMGLLTTHSRDQVEAAKPDFLIQDLTSVSMCVVGQGIRVTVKTV